MDSWARCSVDFFPADYFPCISFVCRLYSMQILLFKSIMDWIPSSTVLLDMFIFHFFLRLFSHCDRFVQSNESIIRLFIDFSLTCRLFSLWSCLGNVWFVIHVLCKFSSDRSPTTTSCRTCFSRIYSMSMFNQWRSTTTTTTVSLGIILYINTKWTIEISAKTSFNPCLIYGYDRFSTMNCNNINKKWRRKNSSLFDQFFFFSLSPSIHQWNVVLTILFVVLTTNKSYVTES